MTLTYGLHMSAACFHTQDIAKLNDPATEIAVRVHDGQCDARRHLAAELLVV